MRSVRPRGGAVLGIGLFLLSGCLGSLEDPDRFLGDASLTPDLGGPACPDVLTTVLASAESPNGCAQASCHSTAVAIAGLDLEAANLIDRLTDTPGSSTCNGIPLIDSTNVAGSLLVQKVGVGPFPCGGRMPTGSTLSDFEIACMVSFLEAEVGGVDAGVPDLGVPDAGGMDMGPPDSGVIESGMAFEAEAMTLTAPFAATQDGSASGGTYVTQPIGVLNPDPDATDGIGRAVFDFTVPNAGPAWIFGRARAESPDSDSFWVRIDDGSYVQWNDLHDQSMGGWIWDDVHDTRINNDQAIEFPLTAGAHRLEIVFREANAQLDRLVITQDPTFTPPSN